MRWGWLGDIIHSACLKHQHRLGKRVQSVYYVKSLEFQTKRLAWYEWSEDAILRCICMELGASRRSTYVARYQCAIGEWKGDDKCQELSSDIFRCKTCQIYDIKEVNRVTRHSHNCLKYCTSPKNEDFNWWIQYSWFSFLSSIGNFIYCFDRVFQLLKLE